MKKCLNLKDHALTVDNDGHFRCSCGQWGDGYLGPIGGEYLTRSGITEATILDWHISHANAIVIEIC